MPIYCFKCNKCGNVEDRLLPIGPPSSMIGTQCSAGGSCELQRDWRAGAPSIGYGESGKTRARNSVTIQHKDSPT